MDTPRRGGRPPSGEPVLVRAFRLLDAFSADRPALTLTQLSEAAGIPLSSTLRLAQSLMGLGAIERLDDGSFTIGLRMLEYAALAPRGHGLRTIALPYMEDLLRATGQHVQLAVRENDDAVMVERLSSPRAPKVLWYAGARIPLHNTGVGLALLAHASEEFQASYLADPVVDEAGLPAFDREELNARLREVRASGVARSSRLLPEPAESVAAPIRDRTGQCIAAISVLGSGDTLNAHMVVPAVVAIARAVSRDLSRLGLRPFK